MDPVASLTQGLGAIDLSTTIGYHTLDIKNYLSLASSLKTLHDQNRVHRNICIDMLSETDDGVVLLSNSEDEACDDDVKNKPATVDVSYNSLPPERTPLYTGSWLPDDVYALGCIFYEVAFEHPVPWTDNEPYEMQAKKENLAPASTHAKNLMQTPQLLKDVPRLLSLWMLHPDPKERPTIAMVCEKLQNVFPHNLPTLTSIHCDGDKEIVLKPSNPTACAKIALEVLGQHCPQNGYAYLPRKKTATNYQIIGSLEKNWILLLPKKSQDPYEKDDEGTFKIGRRATVLEKVGDIWEAKNCYALTSRRGESQSLFKATWAKEMWLYRQLEGSNPFPKYHITFTYPEKSHKCLSLYEAIPKCLFDEDTKAFTPQRAYALALMIEKLHRLGIAHRDVKGENVLVAADGSLVLCDPDSLVQDEMWKNICDLMGTEETIAPERHKQHVGSWFPDDVYALGCLFYEKFINRYLPWILLSSAQMYEKKVSFETSANKASIQINSDKFEETIPEPLNRVAILTHWMLHPNPEMRPTMQRVCEELKKFGLETKKAE